ncbi:hypothetical protein [Sphingomonas panni]
MFECIRAVHDRNAGIGKLLDVHAHPLACRFGSGQYDREALR